MPRGDEGTELPRPAHPDALLDHPTLRRIARALEARPGALAPDDGAPRRAAVAVVFRCTAADELELLLIKRSERDGDPWSGHVALPGGRHDPSDATLQDTAVRETLEETGIDIARDGRVLGTLDEIRPRTPVLPPIIVTPYVTVVPASVAIHTSDEVADTFWVPLASFADHGTRHHLARPELSARRPRRVGHDRAHSPQPPDAHRRSGRSVMHAACRIRPAGIC
jgi:8-oxo-dGTP pyrophosphatase MutT (NUDIX family)